MAESTEWFSGSSVQGNKSIISNNTIINFREVTIIPVVINNGQR